MRLASEVKRRLVHATGAAIPLGYVLGIVDWPTVRWLWVASAAVALVLEALRLSGALEWRIYDTLTREYEQDSLAGYALYMLSMTGVAWLFEPRAAVPAMLMLAIADPISGLLGSGELRAVKGWPVLAATFGVCLLLALPFVAPAPAVLGAAAATLADGAKPVIRGYVIDDNLTIPPAAATGIVVGSALL